METLSDRFVWPGARSPMILEWGNCSKQPKPQHQQQQQKNGNRLASATAAAAAVSKAAVSQSPQMTASLAPVGFLQAGRLTAAQPGQLVAPTLQLQQQQQAVLVLPHGYNLTPQLVTGSAPGQLVFVARY
jgi:hypothetical protein